MDNGVYRAALATFGLLTKADCQARDTLGSHILLHEWKTNDIAILKYYLVFMHCRAGPRATPQTLYVPNVFTLALEI